MLNPILVTSGDPAGIGLDISLAVRHHQLPPGYVPIIVGDINLLKQKSQQLDPNIDFVCVDENVPIVKSQINQLQVLHVESGHKVKFGVLEPENSPYVLAVLDKAINWCKAGLSDIIVTAPVSKEVINRAGFIFSGHTEYLCEAFGANQVVMLLSNDKMKVALLTIHVPLKVVASQVTVEHLTRTLATIINSLEQYGYTNPRIGVCGLNPHAGEGGYLGDEELRVINPVINDFRARGFQVFGSFASDTIFNRVHEFDVILAMYHDQGLPVLKYSGFATGVNITLGLPIIRTSVDHGTAVDLVGTGNANPESLFSAIDCAIKMDQKLKF